MRRPPPYRDVDRLALDNDTVEELLSGALPAGRAPAGYAKVVQLLAAAAAAPTPEELAGQGAALTELRAVARARPAAAMAPAPARRRRWTGLAVVVVVGALVTGGAAGAATGQLPGPVGEAARSILGGGRAPSASTEAGRPPAPVRRPTGAGGGLPGLGPGVWTSRGPAASPSLVGLCQALGSGNGAEEGGKLDATAFQALAHAAGGQDKIRAYCRDVPPDRAEPKEDTDQTPPGGQGQGQDKGQGEGGPPTSTGAGNQGQSEPGTGAPVR